RLTAEILREATGRGMHGTVAMVRRTLGQFALARGDPEEAVEHLQALWSGTTGQRGVAFATIPDLVEAAVRAGRPELGVEHLAAFASWAEASGADEARALAARAAAILAPGAQADALYRSALALHA